MVGKYSHNLAANLEIFLGEELGIEKKLILLCCSLDLSNGFSINMINSKHGGRGLNHRINLNFHL